MYHAVLHHLKSPPTPWGMKPHIRGFCSPRCGGIFESMVYPGGLANYEVANLILTITKSFRLNRK